LFYITKKPGKTSYLSCIFPTLPLYRT
jgi:hypothetical protein